MSQLTDSDFLAALQARMGLKVDDPVDFTAIKTAFWSEMRTALAVSNASVGLEYLEDLAESLIDTHAKLTGLAFLLSAPDDQEASAGPASHSRFQAGVSSAEPSATSKLRKPTNKRATASSKVTTRSTKRPKTSAASSDSSPGRLSAVLSGTLIVPAAPMRELDDLAKVYRQARQQGKEPFRVAYPGAGNRLCYDPTEYPSIHVTHYRLWMTHRKAFWEWGINAPLRSEAAYTARRKTNMNATHARLSFLSSCIETWGYYHFLELFEAKHGPVVNVLAVLYRKDTAHYERLIAGALDPDTITTDGYTSIPQLLELSKAIGPDTRPTSNRLTDRALARIRRDTTSDEPSEAHWSPTPVTGSWAELVNNKRIQDTQNDVDQDLVDDTCKLSSAPDYDRRLDRDVHCSDFEDENGTTAFPPGSDEEDNEDDDDADQEDEEERKDSEIESEDEVNSPKLPTPPSSPVAKTPSSPKSAKRSTPSSSKKS
ncbi:unnamed protein product [Phytophthora fragariaefolia]|uniref:Unnamed protein product n=1 Tax=Phytophthora fragariaefolia TaxID=1490495 RepID=A0A9W6WY79_9STRA|nr:unnamed protein product [Phytophthora fragariaefolia]